jgi:hypothetical protein
MDGCVEDGGRERGGRGGRREGHPSEPYHRQGVVLRLYHTVESRPVKDASHACWLGSHVTA